MPYEVVWFRDEDKREYWVVKDGTRIVAIFEDKSQVEDFLDAASWDDDEGWELIEDRTGEATASSE